MENIYVVNDTCNCCKPMPPECNPQPCGMKGTVNYQLPQWDANTITSWLVQMNYAMRRIDEVMHGLALRTGIDGVPEEVVSEVERLDKEYNRLNTKIIELCNTSFNTTESLTNVQSQIATITNQVATLTTNLVNVDTRLSTVESGLLGTQTSLAKITENLNTLTSSTAELTAEVSDLTDKVTALESKEGWEPVLITGTVIVKAGEYTESNYHGGEYFDTAGFEFSEDYEYSSTLYSLLAFPSGGDHSIVLEVNFYGTDNTFSIQGASISHFTLTADSPVNTEFTTMRKKKGV